MTPETTHALRTMLVLVVLVMQTALISAGTTSDPQPSYLYDWSPNGQPQFVDTPTHVKVKQGSLAILHCWVRQLGDRQVAWRRKADDTFLTVGKLTLVQDPDLFLEHVRKKDGVTSWDLVFRQARREFGGEYECQLTSHENYVRTVTLTVLDEPIYSSLVVLETGQPLQLRCNVSTLNVTGPALYWEKDGRHIDSVLYAFIYITRYQIQYTRTLVTELSIDNVSLEDSGLYTCMTSSRHVLRVTKVTVNSEGGEDQASEDIQQLGHHRQREDQDSSSLHHDTKTAHSAQGRGTTNNKNGGWSLHTTGHPQWMTTTATVTFLHTLFLVFFTLFYLPFKGSRS